MFTDILGFKIFNESKENFMEYINKYEKVNIISGNPEILINGLNNKSLKDSFKKDTSIIIPDGIGTVIASKILGNPIKEKIAGIDIVKELIYKCEQENKPVYFLGSKQEVLLECINNIKREHPNLQIAGYHNGYFDMNQCDEIINEVKNKDIYAIFVAMGSPRQENFINKIMDSSNIKIFMGVGGVFDVFAGKVNRAPKWMINCGMEWLYRVLKEPVRIKRLGVIPIFLIKSIIYRKAK